jgi:uncharacterized protein (TIGR02118 family)
MARLIVSYEIAADPVEFEKRYFEQHVPLAKQIPGLRKYEVSKGPVLTPFGPSPYQLVAILHFDDIAAIQNAFASPEGQAAAADAQKLSGAQMLMFEDRMV